MKDKANRGRCKFPKRWFSSLLFLGFVISVVVAPATTANSRYTPQERHYMENEFSTDSRLASQYSAILVNYFNQQYQSAYPDSYAGAYIDSDKNYVILITEDGDASEYEKVFSVDLVNQTKKDFLSDLGVQSGSVVEKAYQEKELVRYERKKHSFNDLKRVFDYLHSNLKVLQISSVDLIQKSNEVVVYVENESTEQSVQSAIAESPIADLCDTIRYCVEPIHREKAVAQLDQRTQQATAELASAQNLSLYAGTQIGCPEKSNYGTVGFNAYNYTEGTYGVVTCEHVIGAANRANDYHGNAVNNHSLYPSSTINQTDVSLDASFVPFHSTSSIQWKSNRTVRLQNESSGVTISRICPTGSFVEGQTVWKLGRRTGKTSGSITCIFSSSSENSVDIQTDCMAWFGDSGSPLLVRSSSASSYTYYLLGIVKSVSYYDSNDQTTHQSTFVGRIKNILFSMDLELYGDTIDYRIGDLNHDGVVDSADAQLALQYAGDQVNLSTAAFEAGDVNMDTTIDTADAVLILQKASGLI